MPLNLSHLTTFTYLQNKVEETELYIYWIKLYFKVVIAKYTYFILSQMNAVLCYKAWDCLLSRAEACFSHDSACHLWHVIPQGDSTQIPSKPYINALWIILIIFY